MAVGGDVDSGRVESELTLLEHLAVDEIDDGEVARVGCRETVGHHDGTVRQVQPTPQTTRLSTSTGVPTGSSVSASSMKTVATPWAAGCSDVSTYGSHDEMFAIGGVVEIDDVRPLVHDLPFGHDDWPTLGSQI